MPLTNVLSTMQFRRLHCALLFSFVATQSRAQVQPADLPVSRDAGATADPHAETLLADLRAGDAAFDTPWTAAFEIVVPFTLLGPELGVHTKLCRYTENGQLQGLYMELHYHEPPRYQPVGQRGVSTIGPDDAEDFSISRNLRKWSLRTDEMNASYWEQRHLVINPRNQFLSDITNNCVDRFRIVSTDSVYEIMEFRLASGRGFTDLITRIRSIKRLEDGSREINAEGHAWGRPVIWRLKVAAPEDQLLVREAALTFGDQQEAGVVVRTSGEWSGQGIMLAKEASITYDFGRPYKLQIVINDFQPHADGRLVDELRSRVLAPVPEGVTVYDWRSDRPGR